MAFHPNNSGNDEECDAAVLRVNRQFNHDLRPLVWRNRTFKIDVTEFGYSFLKWHRAPDIGPPVFPFHVAEYLEIDVHLDMDPERYTDEGFDFDAEKFFNLRNSIGAVTWLIAERPLKNLNINLIETVRLTASGIRPHSCRGLAESDIELLLQPFRLVRNVGKLEINLVLHPDARLREEDRDLNEGPPFASDPADPWVPNFPEEAEAAVTALIAGVKAAMTDPHYHDPGDYESLKRHTRAFKQLWGQDLGFCFSGWPYGWETKDDKYEAWLTEVQDPARRLGRNPYVTAVGVERAPGEGEDQVADTFVPWDSVPGQGGETPDVIRPASSEGAFASWDQRADPWADAGHFSGGESEDEGEGHSK